MPLGRRWSPSCAIRLAMSPPTSGGAPRGSASPQSISAPAPPQHQLGHPTHGETEQDDGEDQHGVRLPGNVGRYRYRPRICFFFAWNSSSVEDPLLLQRRELLQLCRVVGALPVRRAPAPGGGAA